MESVFDSVKTFCLAQDVKKTFWIAYSGGLDSHVLLHACATLRDQYGFTYKAIHINHGLSPNALAWVEHCKTICDNLQIDFISKEITILSNHGDSLEALGRELRYKALAAYLSKNDVLLTAHHQEDQAETMFLQLMRGAGPKGLSAMPTIKPFAKGFHGRPLLEISKKTIDSYACEHKLKWIEDESNQNIDFSRNYVRQTLFPLLKKRWPAVSDTLARVAEHCAEAQRFIDLAMDEHLANMQRGSGLSISALLTLSQTVQRHVLRRWFTHLHFPIPSAVKMQQIQQSLLLAAEDKMPHIMWGHVELRRYQDVLYAMEKLLMHDETKSYVWDMEQPLILPNVGVLHAELNLGQGFRKDVKQVTVRFRQGGECCRLPGRDFHHDLKKLFQQWGVPPWERSRVPLLFVEDKLVGVVGYHIDINYLAKKDEQARIVTLNH